ncbi:MAG: DUF420 domain-containing protein [Planctomycetota bacterium]|nr:DUF420 domain-containing protein [Planctomycetota bacterium]
MSDGFLGFKTSFMLDAVVVSLVLIVPAILYSIYVVKFTFNYSLHRNLQVSLGVVLFLAVTAFEVDMQWIQGGWENVVQKRDVPLTDEQFQFVRKLLWVHLVFAITTPVLWGITLVLALKRFSNPPFPGPHSPLHRRLAWISTIDIVLTSITGLTFYYMAFIR